MAPSGRSPRSCVIGKSEGLVQHEARASNLMGMLDGLWATVSINAMSGKPECSPRKRGETQTGKHPVAIAVEWQPFSDRPRGLIQRGCAGRVAVMLGIACKSTRCSPPERAARDGERSVLVCGPVAPVDSILRKVGCLLHVDGRP